MAESIASIVIDNVLQLIKDEAELLLGVADQVRTLKDQLKVIRSFLLHSLCNERVRHLHGPIEELVDQLRDIAYDAEDTIDTYLWSEGCCKWLPRFFCNLKTDYQVGKQIEDINQRIDRIKGDLPLYGYNLKQAVEFSEQGMKQKSRKAPVVEENEVVGFDDESKRIISRLLQGDNHLTVISILGMGGIGKTTLAKKVYNDLVIKKYFKQGCAWAYVSQEYSHKQLLLVILKAFKKLTKENEMQEEEIGEQLLQCLKGKRYLIVFDDIWHSKVWEGLKRFFPDNNKGSRVLFTTRVKHVAKEVDPSPHHLHLLNPDESWELLQKKVFRGEKCNKLWEESGRQIAKKCGGLPLAIIVLGGVLFYTRKTFEQWSNAVHCVSSILSERPEDCKEILKYSYDDLPLQLRACFLYFAVFPEDFEIPAKRLIRLWVAEGLVQVPPGTNETREEVAEHYLDELIDRSLIEVVKRRSNGGVKTCKIHDLLRDVSIDEAWKQKFIFQFRERVTDEQSISIIPRRLAGKSSLLRYIYSNFSSKPLHSILCFIQGEPVHDINTYLTSFCNNLGTFLRVLDLEGIVVDNLPNEIGKLFNLRYLSLGRTTITELPDSICNLRNLQTLDVRSKGIHSIPSGIWKLKKLRHVYLQGQICLPPPSSTMDNEPSLVALQTLSTICPSSCTQEIFAQMPNLIKLGIYGDLQSNLKSLSKGRDKLHQLKSLKLKRNLTSAPVTMLPRKFPENLTKISLHNTELEADPLQQLGQLQNLQILKLMEQSYVGYTLYFNSEDFKCLQVLQLMNFYEHKFELEMEEGALPSLEQLVIHNCHSLQKVPDKLWGLTTMKIINLWEPSAPVRSVILQKENEIKQRCKIEMFPPETH
ncbi:putative disease resistance RPP13-like protein 3 [Macadamia integrifolia]|uniref:putative disease resistance RPP13-like protein 3 n=1 Tax=Macadamia integrifolia TaxID=60698 RepID=UPI001C529641|nr:putative disease resistance RPP13-like protein 3 [Macadamia integrifolia]